MGIALISLLAVDAFPQQAVSIGAGSFASFAPLSESRSTLHGGSLAYQTEHRTLYLPDSLLARLGAPDGSAPGTLALPTNDWWTYALVNQWTGKIWAYPAWIEATESGISIGYPDHWEPTGCEMKWDTPLLISAPGFRPAAALVDSWSDYSMSFLLQDGDAWIRTTCVHGSPFIYLEANGVQPVVNNPNASKYTVFTASHAGRNYLTVALLSADLSREDVQPFAFRIPRKTILSYHYEPATSQLTTTFHSSVENVLNPSDVSTDVLLGFLPHHYYNTTLAFPFLAAGYDTPRGRMRLAQGNDFAVTYAVHGMLPFFPAPAQWPEGYNPACMQQLVANYAAAGTFGADTYWGGKGLTQMAHYMTFALQMGDTANYRLAKKRLRETLVDWYTYTPGESQFYFARFPRFGALVGFDPSYDSETFNDHHFHYGYFVYASAILCMLDPDFRRDYGPAARELARDYANWQRSSADEPWFRTLDPYCGHSFAGGMGNQGNGNGQESSSEAMQGWGGVWMLGAALGDQDMLEAGIFGYTLEARATAEYWYDRDRRNIDYTKYQHPYCCNLTMQGVGWWTWFSGDPVWMHSIQWLPISPVLANYLSEDLEFARWDYTRMYQGKEIGNYEAPSGGLGDESGLGNVCLSYLALFDPDSAARVWERMDAMGKALARNTDTGGITYWLAHTRRALGNLRYDIRADYPLACAYTTPDGLTTYAVFNATSSPLSVRFTAPDGLHSFLAEAGRMTLFTDSTSFVEPYIADEDETAADSLRPDFPLPFPNIALHKPVEASSYENVGTLPVYANDGDRTTRWGSAHHDNESITIDLGVPSYVDYVVIRWEAAYASRFRLEMSDDQLGWQSVEASCSGGVSKTDLFMRGRYLRLTGLQRATPYGTSFYEIEAYGMPFSGDTASLFVLTINTDQQAIQTGETPIYTVQGYNMNAQPVACNPQVVVSQTTDSYTVTASVGEISASHTWPILESEQMTQFSIMPAEVTLPIGEQQRFSLSALNQFGYIMSQSEETYMADSLGTHLFIRSYGALADTALIHVVGYSDMNLALGKTAIASGAEGDGTSASKAVDGNLATRWSSRFQDGEWLEVDLGDCYQVDSVRLFWEAAYATSYDILLSEDALNYHTVYMARNAKGGLQQFGFAPENARYVRILCNARNTGYGSSLWEMEVYGLGRCSSVSTDVEPAVGQSTTVKFIRDGHLYILRASDGAIYDVLGRRVE